MFVDRFFVALDTVMDWLLDFVVDDIATWRVPDSQQVDMMRISSTRASGRREPFSQADWRTIS